jgi:hypothetical protein
LTAAADPLEALRDYLLSDTDVATAVANRVRCLQLLDVDIDVMPYAVVLLTPAGGPGAHGYQQFGKKRIDVTCFGATKDESWDVYLKVKPVLHELRRYLSDDGVLIHTAEEEAAGAAGIDPFTQWPTTYSSWLVTASEVAAA